MNGKCLEEMRAYLLAQFMERGKQIEQETNTAEVAMG